MVSKFINWDVWLLNKISYSHPYVSLSLMVKVKLYHQHTWGDWLHFHHCNTLLVIYSAILLRSLIYTLNNWGERIPPCLTPLLTGNTSDSTDTHLTQSVWLQYHLPFTIYHQGFFRSVRRNPSLNCFHIRRSLAIIGHAVPRWRTRLSLHLVLGLPCRLVHYRGVHSVTLLVHLLSLKRAMCPAHPCIPFLITSMMSFTPVWCRIQVLRLWSRRVMPSMVRSILRCATDSSSMWAFFSAHVSLPYTMTGNTYSLANNHLWSILERHYSIIFWKVCFDLPDRMLSKHRGTPHIRAVFNIISY